MTERHRARKSLGQNFLVDPHQQRRIIDALDPAPDDTVLEIGPGHGALSRHLAGRVRRLILVELDDRLAAALRHEYADLESVNVIHADFMALEPAALATDPAGLIAVGNIPYNITTPIIFRLLERCWRPRRIVLTVQKEVADRIVAPPGDGDYGALSVGVRTVARVDRLFTVRRGAFRPVPGVDSAVIRIEPFRPFRHDEQEDADLRELTRTVFSWRRKQLQKTLRSAPAYALDAATLDRVLHEAGVPAAARPEELDPDRFIRLARALRYAGRPLPGGQQ
jgi:16S rRNA (adenine1518-N6/adenine1519-N6)-dimethyltransferase